VFPRTPDLNEAVFLHGKLTKNPFLKAIQTAADRIKGQMLLDQQELSGRMLLEGKATRISCARLQTGFACAAFSKESRMKFANANKLDGKSGGPTLSVKDGERLW
jgi:hypothetical protein